MAPECKTFYWKSIKKYTYNTIEHLNIPIHIIYAYPLIPITKNINIYTSKFYITITEISTYKNQKINSSFMVTHRSLDVPFYWAHHWARLEMPLRIAFLHSTLQSSLHGSVAQLQYLIDISINIFNTSCAVGALFNWKSSWTS